MQMVTKKVVGRPDRPPEFKGDVFDPHFPGIKTAAEVVQSTQRPTIYDPYFPASLRSKGSTHV